MPTVMLWLPVVLCGLMMLVGCGGLMLLQRSQDGRGRSQRLVPEPGDRLAGLGADGAKEHVDG